LKKKRATSSTTLDGLELQKVVRDDDRHPEIAVEVFDAFLHDAGDHEIPGLRDGLERIPIEPFVEGEDRAVRALEGIGALGRRATGRREQQRGRDEEQTARASRSAPDRDAPAAGNRLAGHRVQSETPASWTSRPTSLSIEKALSVNSKASPSCSEASSAPSSTEMN
jgi:hypothetical protein